MENRRPVVGLEIHAQLKTRTKLFCGCAWSPDASPNTETCPVCLGLPGSLPAINHAAVVLALRLARALGCHIHPASRFDRKHYHYPDLPRGFQITQQSHPLATGGMVSDPLGNPLIQVERLHLEEDAGRSRHFEDRSVIDHNRCGAPLVEIVTAPGLVNGEQAATVLKWIRALVRHLDVCDGNLETGQMRCDANISISTSGAVGSGNRVEVKNLNSVRFLRRAIDHEIERQTAILSAGGTVLSETRLYNEKYQYTQPMRRKETMPDYRYLAEPDLPELLITDHLLEAARPTGPGPADWVAGWRDRWQMDQTDALFFAEEPALARYVEETLKRAGMPDPVCRWIRSDVLALWNPATDSQAPVSPDQLAGLARLLQTKTITDRTARTLIPELAATGLDPDAVVAQRGLAACMDPEKIRAIIGELVSVDPALRRRHENGDTRVMHHLMGQVMSRTNGQADPALTRRLLIRLLEKQQ